MTGSSTLILTKANTNKGLTRVNAGKLELGNNSNIGAVTVANIAGASLDVDGGTATIRTLNGGDNSDIDFGTDGTLIVYQNTNGDFEGTTIDMDLNRHLDEMNDVDVEEGDIIIFPSTLEHLVRKNMSDKLRITVSFNINRVAETARRVFG